MRRSLSRASCAFVLAVLVGFAVPARAAWNPDGELIPAVGIAPGPASCPDSQGGAFMFWSERHNDGVSSRLTLWGRRLASDGTDLPGWPASGRMIATCPVRSSGIFDEVQAAADGGGGAFVLAADPTYWSLHSRRLFHVGGDGALASGWPSAGVAVGDSTPPSLANLAADGVGGAYVAWTDLIEIDPLSIPNTRSLYEARVTRILGDGSFAPGWTANGKWIEGAAPESLLSGRQEPPRLAADPAGGVFVANADSSDGDRSVHVWHFTPGGNHTPGWPAAGIALHTTVGRGLAAFASDAVGGLYVAYTDSLPYPDGGAPRLLRFDGSGQPSPGWPAGGIVPFTASQPYRALGAAVGDGQGGVFLLGSSFDLAAHSQVHIVHRDGNGALHPGWSPQGVTVQESLWVAVDRAPVSDGRGGIYAVWMASRDISASAFDLRSLRLRADGTAEAGWSVGTPRRVAMPYQAFVYDVTGDGQGSCYAVSGRTGNPTSATWVHQIAPDDANTLTAPAPFAGAPGLALAASPNPALGTTELSFVLPRDSRATLAIHDASGRRVRRWSAAMPAGPNRVTWDGRTDSGAPAAAGVYFAVVRAGSLEAARRIAVVR